MVSFIQFKGKACFLVCLFFMSDSRTYSDRNPALEDQACDRIYRVGQTRDVTIHRSQSSKLNKAMHLFVQYHFFLKCLVSVFRFECEGTVEEKIATLQAKKKELAQNVLSGKGSTLSKLSLADLRIIFGV